MIPMVAGLGELRRCKRCCSRAQEQVRARGQPCADEIPLGVMIEVPSAAIMVDHFAREAAFLSLGTNDLIQYALAVDRTSRSLAYLASPFDPSILRLITKVIQAGQDFGRPVSSAARWRAIRSPPCCCSASASATSRWRRRRSRRSRRRSGA